MMKKFIACFLAVPLLASANGRIDTLGSQWCGSVAELAVIQSYRQDGVTPRQITDRISDSMPSGPLDSKLENTIMDVLTRAEYQWKGMTTTTVKSLAFSTCKLGLVRNGVY